MREHNAKLINGPPTLCLRKNMLLLLLLLLLLVLILFLFLVHRQIARTE